MAGRFKMPDLTNPKWQRRDKLNAINFANKGKSGYKQIMNAMEQKKIAPQQPAESLPSQKVSLGSQRQVGDPYYSTIVESMLELPKKVQAIDLHRFRESQRKVFEEDARRLEDPVRLLHTNGRLGRTSEAEQAYALIPQKNIEELNALMDAYSNAGQLDKVTQLFASKRSEANVKSYGILIKTLVACDRTDDAFKAYELMKTSLNQPVSMQIYTSLLKGCTRSGDVQRAISLFEHIKSVEPNKSERPDALVYSHIIHSCAKAGMVEKAFVYFDEMLQQVDSDNNLLVPLDSTFNALIHGCAKNIGQPSQDKFGYQKAFELCELMQDTYGVAPNKITFQYLLLACAQQGDTKRTQSLLSKMRDQGMEVTSQSQQWAIASYAQAPRLISQLYQLDKSRKAKRLFEKSLAEGDMGQLNEQRVEQNLKPIEPQEYVLSDSFDPNQSVEVKMDEFDPQFVAMKDYILEDKDPQQKLQELYSEATELMSKVANETIHIANAKINVLGAFHRKSEMVKLYDSLGTKVNSISQQRVLFHLAQNQLEYCNEPLPSRDFLLQSAKRVFQDYERFRAQFQFPNDWNDLDKKYLRQKYYSQRIGHAQKKTEYQILSMYKRLLEQCNQDSSHLRNLIKARGFKK